MLNCRRNRLSTLDISMCKNLEYLYCDFNKIENLNLSQNKKLKGLTCDGNQLTNLDISMLPNLNVLECSYNKITKRFSPRDMNELFDIVNTKIAKLNSKTRTYDNILEQFKQALIGIFRRRKNIYNCDLYELLPNIQIHHLSKFVDYLFANDNKLVNKYIMWCKNNNQVKKD